ncbi:5220_t:CDS:2, partial [Cetraspora pellucida]
YRDLIVENKYDRILSIVNIDSKLKAIIQHVLMFNKLPNNLQSNSQRERSCNELWLLDREIDNSTIIIELQSIVKVTPIVILYSKDNINILSLIFIYEILYKYQKHWKLRSIKYSYKHPSEFVTLEKNDLAEIKRHDTLKEYCTCSVAKDSWTSSNLDLSLVSCYYYLTDSQFEEISAVPTEQRCKKFATEYELYLQPLILDKLKCKRHLQSPQDVYYLIADKVLKFLKIIIDAFSTERKSLFIKF